MNVYPEMSSRREATIMAPSERRPSWIEEKDQVITLVNPTNHNFILELPAGRYRLDAGRRMRTLRTITQIRQVQDLIDQGQLVVEDKFKSVK